MTTNQFLSLAVKAGVEVEEYETHYCLRKNVEVRVMVTLPKVTYIATMLLKKLKAILGL